MLEPMRIASLATIAVLSLLPTHGAVAQHYERHWNTTVVGAPQRSGPITTAALPRVEAGAGRDPKPASPHAMAGLASYYWQGNKTASGEPFNKNALTAAHRTLPMNTRVKVTNVESGRSVVVRINDRGPFMPDRVVDLSDRAAEILGFKAKGLVRVELEEVR
jgi:rare lipoprotein A